MDNLNLLKKCPKGFRLGDCDDTTSDSCEYSVITGGCCGNECLHCGGTILRTEKGYECPDCGKME